MHRKSTKVGVGVAIVLAALTMGGCVVSARPAAVYVAPAPPAPQVEVIGVAPAPGYVWFGGYWEWVGGRHVWRGGHWGPGRPGYRWVGHHWVQGPGGNWHMVEGHWER